MGDLDRLEESVSNLSEAAEMFRVDRDRLQQENERLRGRMTSLHTEALGTHSIVSGVISNLEYIGGHSQKATAGELRRINLDRMISMSSLEAIAADHPPEMKEALIKQAWGAVRHSARMLNELAREPLPEDLGARFEIVADLEHWNYMTEALQGLKKAVSDKVPS